MTIVLIVVSLMMCQQYGSEFTQGAVWALFMFAIYLRRKELEEDDKH